MRLSPPVTASPASGAAPGRPAANWPLTGLLLLLSLPMAALTLAMALLALAQPQTLDYGESIVYGQASRLLNGQALYQPLGQPPYTVTAYTPLFYAAAAALHATLGPGFGPGRGLSLAAGLVSAGLVAWLAARHAATRPVQAGVLAAALFLALDFPGPTPWLGLYRVDLLGLPLSLGAIVLLARSPDPRSATVAGLLAALAFLDKQTFFAALLAGGLWLWTRDRPRALRFTLTATATAALPLAILQLTTGALWASIVLANVNPFDAGVFTTLLGDFALTQAVPLGLAVLWVLMERPWRSDQQRLLLLYWIVCGWWVLALGKIGANHNYWLEFGAATAVLAGATVSALPKLAHTPGLLVGLAATLGLVTLYVPWSPSAAPTRADAFRTELAAVQNLQQREEFLQLVERVRSEPGLVLAEPMDVVVLAGRPIVLEPLISSLLLNAGHWDPTPLVSRICQSQISLLVLAYPLDDGPTMMAASAPVWPPPVMDALQQVMGFEGIQAGRYLYVPRPGSSCD